MNTAIAACFTLALLGFAAASQPTCNSERVTCEVCPKGADSNFIGLLPRRDFNFKEVSSNMADFGWVNCTGPAEDRSCKFFDDFDIMDIPDRSKESSRYFQSVALYAGVAVLMILISYMWITCFVFWRYCCCCCCRASQACKCGGKYPTRRTRCIGYSHQPGNSFGYTKRGRILSLLYVISYLGILLAFILVAEFKGNKALTTAMKGFAGKSADPVMELTIAGYPVIARSVIKIAADNISPIIQNFSRNAEGTNLTALEDALTCTVNKIDTFPDVSDAVEVVTDLKAGVTNLDASLTHLRNNLTVVSTQQSDLDGDAIAGQTMMTNFISQKDTLRSSITTFISRLNVLSTLPSDVTGTSGWQTYAKGNLSNFQANYPANATALDISTGISELLAGDYNDSSAGSVANIQTLHDNINTVKTKITALTSLTTVIAAVDTFNTQAGILRLPTLSNILASKASTEAAVTGLYSTAYINSTLQAILDGIAVISLNNTKSALTTVDAAIAGLIDFNRVRSLLDNIAAISDAVPCIENVVSGALSVENWLVNLPDELDIIRNLTSKLTDALNPALDKINEVKLLLNDGEVALNSNNVTKYAMDVTNAESSLTAAKTKLNMTKVEEGLTTLNTSLTFTFTDTDSVSALDAAIAVALVSPATKSKLQAAVDLLTSMSPNVNQAVTNLADLVNGFCDETSAPCTADAAGCTCIRKGVMRCKTAIRQGCTVNADCPPADNCLADAALFNSLKDSADSIQPSFVYLTETVAKITALESAISGIDVVDLKSELADGVTALDGFDYAEMTTSLSDLRTGLAGVTVSTYSDLVSEIQGSLASIPFTSVNSTLLDFNGTVVEFKTDYRKIVMQAKNATVAIQYFLDELFPSYLSQLSSATLTAAYDTNGLGGLFLAITNVFADMGQQAYERINILDDPFIEKSMVDQLNQTEYFLPGNKYRKFLDALSLPSSRSYGSIYYFANMAAALDMELMGYKVHPASDPQADTLLYNKQGEKYDKVDGKDAICLTQACIENTVALVNDKPVSDKQLSYYIGASFNANGSRENAFELLLIIPFLIVLLGIWGLTCAACCCKNKPSWQKVPLSWMTGCTFAQMPCIFLFAGLFFMFVILLGDGCQSYGGLAVQYAEGAGLCQELGNGSFGACIVTETMRDRTAVNQTVDFRRILGAVLGNCPSGTDPVSQPLLDAANTLKPFVVDVIKDFLNETFNSTDSGSKPPPITMHHKTTDVFLIAANNMGDTVHDVVADLATNVITCPKLNGLKMGVHEALCCDFLSALYWWVGAWYIIAWSMCFCGCCSGQLARKRLVRFPWGPQYDQDVTEIPHMGTLEMVVSPAVYDYDPNKLGHQSQAEGVSLFPGEPGNSSAPGYEQPMYDESQWSLKNQNTTQFPRDAAVYPEDDNIPTGKVVTI